MDKCEYKDDYECEATKKYEGGYTAEEIELNKKLYEECSKDQIDFATVEDFLKQGADPLGGTEICGWGLLDHICGDLVGGAR